MALLDKFATDGRKGQSDIVTFRSPESEEFMSRSASAKGGGRGGRAAVRSRSRGSAAKLQEEPEGAREEALFRKGVGRNHPERLQETGSFRRKSASRGGEELRKAARERY